MKKKTGHKNPAKTLRKSFILVRIIDYWILQ